MKFIGKAWFHIKTFLKFSVVKRWNAYAKDFDELSWWRRVFLVLALAGTGKKSITAWYANSAQNPNQRVVYKLVMNNDKVTEQEIARAIHKPYETK